MKKNLLTLFVVLFLFLPFSLHASPPGNISNWTLTFDDEFTGTTLDKTKWGTYYEGQDMHTEAGNDELEWYSSGAVTVNNGLTITATNVPTPGSKCATATPCPYTSGMIETYNRFYQMYGYFEASIQIPKGQGLWPAFWMLPYPFTWPPEIDIFENLGNDPTTIYLTNHWTSNYPGTSTSYDEGGSEGGTSTGVDLSKAFHTYGINWTPTSITWYLDNVQVYQVTDHVPIAGYGFSGMHPIINLAVGGSWGGDPDGSTVLPAYMKVQYVRAYEYTPSAAYTITASAGTGGTITPSGAVSVAGGASQTFEIAPRSGYSISSVLVDGSSAGAVSSYTFKDVTAKHTIAANFTSAPALYSLAVTKNGTGSGTVSSNPSGNSFTAGTVVTLTAVPGSGSIFGGWSGSCSGTSATCELTMSGDESVMATFNAARPHKHRFGATE